MPANLEKSAVATGLEKVSFHYNYKERQGEIRKPSSVISTKIEENNRMGKTRDLFKKIRDTKGNVSCKDGLNKGQNWYGPNRGRKY